MSQHSNILRALCGSTLASLVVFACGNSQPVDGAFPGGEVTSGNKLSSGGASGGGFGSGGGGASGSPGSSGSGGAQGDGGNCSAPVDMFIMFDRSGSMGSDCAIGDKVDSKWCRSINALSGYLKSAGAVNQAAALQFFPLANHSAALCSTGEGYQVAALPSASYEALPSSIFDAKLNSEAPPARGAGGGGPSTGGGTPTEAAIRGISRFTTDNRRPGRVTIGVLITDGDPRNCEEDLSILASMLAAHNTATKIRTYVIGMEGATFANLETIAKGGGAPAHPDAVGSLTDACGDGSGPCTHWNVGNGDPAAFAAALAAIQESADGCKPGGGTVNPPPR
jgi:hypothetical protein